MARKFLHLAININELAKIFLAPCHTGLGSPELDTSEKKRWVLTKLSTMY